MNLDQSGQHYMIDKDLIKFIVNEAMLLPTDVVLEIGYGRGELTRELAKKCKVIAVDTVETNLDSKNITKIRGNILEIFEELFEKYGFNKIISNIPYNISEPLMRKIFKVDVEMVLLTIGKKFSDILKAEDNRISIIANHLYDIEVMKIVPPKAFSPMPRVDSAIVMMRQKDIDSVPKASAIYKELAMLEEKKLKNCFDSILGENLNKKKIKELTKDELFNKKLYQLSNKEFLKLDHFVNRLE